jgi:hypothetical protein
MYSCIKKEKWHLLKTVLGKEGRGIKKNDGGNEINYDIL